MGTRGYDASRLTASTKYGPRGGVFLFGEGPVVLDLFADGSFSRNSVGTYLIGAPNADPSVSGAFLADAVVNERRLENRGDFTGLLIEGSRFNGFQHSADLTQGNWLKFQCVPVADQFSAPDATLTADRYNPSTAASRCTDVLPQSIIPQSVRGMVSFWVRSLAGAPTFASRVSRCTGGIITTPHAISTTYSRVEVSYDTLTGAQQVQGGPANDGVSLTDAYVWGCQYEIGYWPSSYIRTAANQPTTREPDILTFPPGAYSSRFRSEGITFQLAPRFTSAEHVASNSVRTLARFGGGGDDIRFEVSGGTSRVSMYRGGVLHAQSAALTYSRDQLMTFTGEPDTGNLIVAGATAGNGTTAGPTFTWPVAPLNFGSDGLGNFAVFGRFGQFAQVAP